MKNPFIFLTLFAVAVTVSMAMASSANAQTISGILVDEQDEPVPMANVVLLASSDSSFVAGTITGEGGGFSFDNIGDSSACILRFSAIGYVTCYMEISQDNLGKVNIQTDAEMLGGAIVRAGVTTTLKGDAMVTNITGTIYEKAGTLEDLLDKIPLVTAKDGEVEVFGRGTPEIYINGRKVMDNGELDQLSSENIKTVEVVTNPGAKYAATTKSVIRIHTKKQQGEGFGFDERAAIEWQRTGGWSPTNDLYLNYSKNGFEANAAFYYWSSNKMYGQQVTQTSHLGSDTWFEDMDMSYQKQRQQSIQPIISLNYQFNDRHSIGARYSYNDYFKAHQYNKYTSSLYFNDGLYETGIYDSDNNFPRHYHSLNLYYNGELGKWTIDLNADGYWSKVKEHDFNDENIETLYEPDQTSMEQNDINTYSTTNYELYAAKLEVSRQLWKGSLSFGGEYSHARRTNVYTNDSYIPLDDSDSKFDETNTSAFLTYGFSLGDGFSFSAGARYEHIGFKYYNYGKLVPEQSRKYDNVFPSANLSFKLWKGAFAQLSYSMHTARPSYSELDGTIYYINRYSYSTGNPFLQPAIWNDVTLTAVYGWASLYVYYGHVKNDTSQSTGTFSEDLPAIALLKYENIDPYDEVDAFLQLSPKIKCWTPQWGLGVMKQWYKMDILGKNTKMNKPIGQINWNNNFSLPLGFVLDVDSRFLTRGNAKNYYLTDCSWVLNISLLKSFFNDSFSVKLDASDIFETNHQGVIVYSGLRNTTADGPSFATLKLTLRYKFNTSRSHYKGTGAGNEQRQRM